MTNSERAFVAAFFVALLAGFIAGQAWPQADGHVSHALGAFVIACSIAFLFIVLSVRRGRP